MSTIKVALKSFVGLTVILTDVGILIQLTTATSFNCAVRKYVQACIKVKSNVSFSTFMKLEVFRYKRKIIYHISISLLDFACIPTAENAPKV